MMVLIGPHPGYHTKKDSDAWKKMVFLKKNTEMRRMKGLEIEGNDGRFDFSNT